MSRSAWFLTVLPFCAWCLLGAAAEGPAAIVAYAAIYALLGLPVLALGAAVKVFRAVAFGPGGTSWSAVLARAARFHGAVMLALLGTFAWFVAYNNEVAPARLPVVVLSDGDRTLTFRAMAHVASPEFFSGVVADVRAARASGAVLLYEGVRPGTASGAERLSRILGMRLDRDAYAPMAKVAGLAQQLDYPLPTQGTGAVNADVSVDQMVAAYDAAASGSSAARPLPDDIPDLAQFVPLFDALPERSRRFVAYVARSGLNFTVRHEEGVRDLLRAQDPALAAALLDLRDREVARAVLAMPGKNIYATYGLMHFQGVYDELRRADARWNIKAVGYDRPVR